MDDNKLSIYPMAILIEELKNLLDDEEEVLNVLAETLGKFMEFIGGPSFSMHLIRPLEQLTTVEENSVREKAIESIKKVLSEISIKESEADVMDIIRRLVADKWYTAKIAATSLIPFVFLQVNPDFQQELISQKNDRTYQKCAKDEVPQVRRIAASNLKDFAGLIPQFPNKEALQMFQEFNKDEQDSVRLMSIENLLALHKAVPGLIAEIVHDTVKGWAEDKSWRIRYVMAEKICDLAKILDKEYVDTSLSEYFASFMQDPEAEVRVVSASKVGNFIALLDPAGIPKFLPSLKKLSADIQPHVRRSLAESFSNIAHSLGPDNTKEHLIPIMSGLLGDDSPEVRISTLSNIEEISKLIDKESLLKGIIPAIEKIHSDPSWRVRVTAIEAFITYTKVLGEEEKLTEYCAKWLEDPVFTVRKAGVATINKLIAILGYSWTKGRIAGKLLELQSHSNYLYRTVPLMAFEEFVETIPENDIKEVYVPSIIKMAKDKVPNIRIAAAKCLVLAAKKVKDCSKIRGILSDLAKDTDPDVRKAATTIIDDYD